MRYSADITASLFYPKEQYFRTTGTLDGMDRKRFRSTFHASKIGDQKKMD